MHQESTTAASKPKCTDCLSVDAALICHDCKSGTYYCQACFDTIHRPRALRAHKTEKLRSVGGISHAPPVRGPEAQPLMCAVHPSQPVELVCRVDDQLGCKQCSTTTHAGHKMIDPKQYKICAQSHAAAVSTVQSLKKAIEDVCKMKQDVESQRQALHTTVNDLCDKLIVSVNTCRAKSLQEVNRRVLGKETLLDTQLRDLSAHLQAIEGHHSQVSAQLALQDHTRAIQATEELKKALKTTQGAQLPLQPVTLARVCTLWCAKT
jgi:hypothetical protein